MKAALGFFLLVTFSATPLVDFFRRSHIIVWNVGQGQWVTAVDANQCQHFDTGGEFFPFKKASALCGDRLNKIFLSHWDWDHVGALSRWPKWNSCVASAPLGKTSARKMKMLERFDSCLKEDITMWTPALSKDTNAESRVVEYQGFLLPGDSPKTQEKIWQQLSWIAPTRVLVLGHHGSRTSTSKELIDRLPHLKMAVASARWARYKHPHAETVALLKLHHIALLRTEDWGNIWFEQ